MRKKYTVKRTFLKEKDFESIKSLLEMNVPVSKISKILGRGESTINTIGQAKTFQEYKQIVSDRNKKYADLRENKLPLEQHIKEKENTPSEVVSPRSVDQQEFLVAVDKLAKSINSLVGMQEDIVGLTKSIYVLRNTIEKKKSLFGFLNKD